VSAIGSDPVASQIGALRAIAADVRFLWRRGIGSELALTSTSAARWPRPTAGNLGVQRQQGRLRRRGGGGRQCRGQRARSQAWHAAGTRQGLRCLHAAGTASVTPDGVALLNGRGCGAVQVTAVNVMAMDYGDGAAPNPSARWVLPIDAATDTDALAASNTSPGYPCGRPARDTQCPGGRSRSRSRHAVGLCRERTRSPSTRRVLTRTAPRMG